VLMLALLLLASWCYWVTFCGCWDRLNSSGCSSYSCVLVFLPRSSLSMQMTRVCCEKLLCALPLLPWSTAMSGTCWWLSLACVCCVTCTQACELPMCVLVGTWSNGWISSADHGHIPSIYTFFC
jgi:hypothetical protein